MPESLHLWLGVVRRQWWVVVLTMAVAVAVPYVSARNAQRPEPTYEGEARVRVEPETLSAYYRLPGVDELLQDVTSLPYMERTASDLEVDPVVLQQRARIFSLRNPQTSIAVTFRSSEASEALRVAEGVAQRVADRALVLGKAEVTELRREVRLTERAIDAIVALEVDTDPTEPKAQRAAATRSLWDMRLRLASMRDGLSKIENAYRYDGPATVRELPVIERRASGAAGALLAGLAAGLAIAAVREAQRSRRMKKQV